MKSHNPLILVLIFVLFSFSLRMAESQLTIGETPLKIDAGQKKVKKAERLKVESYPALGYRFVAEGKAANVEKFYVADKRRIMLFPSLEKFAVELKDPKITTTAALKQIELATGKAGSINLESHIRDEGIIFFQLKEKASFADLEQMLQNLAQSGNFKRVGYIYINEETGKEVALTGRLVVRLNQKDNKDELIQFAKANNLVLERPMHGSDREFLLESQATFTDPVLDICEKLAELSYVEWADPDFLFQLELHFTPNDPLFNSEWHLHNTGQTGATQDADVDAPDAWDNPGISPGGSPDIVIAIIDTGVQTTHPDLSIYINEAENSGAAGVDDDANGYEDDINGWDFYHDDNNPNPGLQDGYTTRTNHGTCCAGVAAATGNNSLGVAGVAYNCKILPVKIVSDTMTFATSAKIADAIRYAADMADVLSNSWGGGAASFTKHSAIQYAVNTRGKPVFFSSGNDADGTNDSPVWMHYTLGSIPAGTLTYKWKYTKNASGSSGDDTAWLDDVTFPGGGFEGFEGTTFPPVLWTTGGDANWTQYSESKHVRGTGAKSAKAGTIGDNQNTYLQVTMTDIAGSLGYYAWVSSEANYIFAIELV